MSDPKKNKIYRDKVRLKSIRNSGSKRISFAEYEQMWEAFKDKQMPEHVARVTGIGYDTVLKYINRGDPARAALGFVPLKARWKMFVEGAEFREQVKQADLLRLRALQHSNLANAAYEAMRGDDPERKVDLSSSRKVRAKVKGECTLCGQMTEIEGETTVKVPRVDPELFMALSEKELKLYREREMRDAGGERSEVVKVDLSDPRAAQLLELKIKRLSAAMLQAGMKEIINCLDPTGRDGIIDRLPISHQIIITLDPNHENFNAEAEILARRYAAGYGRADVEDVAFKEVSNAPEPKVIFQDTPEG